MSNGDDGVAWVRFKGSFQMLIEFRIMNKHDGTLSSTLMMGSFISEKYLMNKSLACSNRFHSQIQNDIIQSRCSLDDNANALFYCISANTNCRAICLSSLRQMQSRERGWKVIQILIVDMPRLFVIKRRRNTNRSRNIVCKAPVS